MTKHTLADLVGAGWDDRPLWSPGYKIPWNDPDFSRRMLREHLSQDHDLASRRAATVAAQAAWLADRFLPPAGGRVLDLGCGPGLYAPHFLAGGRRYAGVDFSPASIDHARHHPGLQDAAFVLGDLLDAPLGGPHDLALLLYGEFNVFPPEDAARLLARVRDALAPGGTLVLEVQTPAAVRTVGQGPDTWSAAPSGLFSDSPYLCLVRNRWFAAEATARQTFFVVDAGTAEVEAMSSTTRAWTEAELAALLAEAGFVEVRAGRDWPGGGETFALFSAVRPGA